MARTIVIITLSLWSMFLLFCTIVANKPELAFLPLYGLYPGELASGEPDYSPKAMHGWAIAAGVIFLALAIAGAAFKKRPAAIAFMVLFILSTFVSCARMASSLGSIH